MTNHLYNIANDYFMAHQPEFMLGLIILFPAIIIIALLVEAVRIGRDNV